MEGLIGAKGQEPMMDQSGIGDGVKEWCYKIRAANLLTKRKKLLSTITRNI